MLLHSMLITGADAFLDTRITANFDLELLLKWGADFGPLTLGGQYWRTITTMFVHINNVHLLCNLLFLWRLGIRIDRILSRTTALGIYLLTGAAASVVSLWWHPFMISYGASGAVYGQAGVLISLLAFAKLDLPRRRKIGILVWTLFLLLPVELIWSRVSKEIDYAGHIGGAISGIILGCLLAWTFRPSQEERRVRQRCLLAYSLLALVVMFAAAIYLRHNVIKEYRETVAWVDQQGPASRASIYARRGYRYLADSEFDMAALEFQRSLEIKPGDSQNELMLGTIYIHLGRYGEAVRLFRQSVSHGPETSDKYSQVAMVLIGTRHDDEAEQMARKAVELGSKSRSNHELLATILLANGKHEEAERERKLAEQLPASK